MSFQIFQTIVQRTFFITKNAPLVQEQLCNYSRWAHRRPSKITFPNQSKFLTEEEVINLDLSSIVQNDENTSDYREYEKTEDVKKPRKSSDIKKPQPKEELFNFRHIDKMSKPYINENPKVSVKTKAKKIIAANDESGSDSDKEDKQKMKPHRGQKTGKRVTEILKVFDENGDYIYTKLGNNDLDMGNLIIKVKSYNKRGYCGQVLVEGWRMIADGLLAGCQLDKLMFSRLEDLDKLKPFMPAEGPQILKMPYREIQQWSNLETSPGIMGIFKTPDLLNKLPDTNVFPINIICDNIREPGNLGSILRAALGVGCRRIILTKGCVDIWDPKVLRSASGAHFRVPIHTGQTWDDISILLNDESSVFIADNNSDNDLANKVKLIRNERTGGPVPYTFQDRKKHLNLDKEEDLVDLSVEMRSNGDLYAVNIPLIPYFDVDFSVLDSVTIIIGGETEGISQECYQFGKTRNGTRLHVPLMPGVDSLNTGMAMSIIAFEVKRQYLKAVRNTDDVVDKNARVEANV